MKKILLFLLLLANLSIAKEDEFAKCGLVMSQKMFLNIKATVQLKKTEQIDAAVEMCLKVCVKESPNTKQQQLMNQYVVLSAKKVFGEAHPILNAWIAARAPHLKSKISPQGKDSKPIQK